MRRIDRKRYLSSLWLVGAVVVILLATLAPQPEWRAAERPFMASLRLPRSKGGWFDVCQNICLYLPLGIAAAAAGYRLAGIVVSAAFLSFLIEVTQFVIPGRDPSARDVVANTIGALMGSMIWTLPIGATVQHGGTRVEEWIAGGVAASASRASTLALAWSGAVSAIFLVTGALLVPALPGDGLWVVSPVLDGGSGPLRIGNSGHPGGHFAGTIDEVRIYDRPRTEHQIAEDMQRPVISATPDPSLVAAYGFDSDTGEVAEDAGGRQMNGRIEGAVWTASGRVAGALQFDGRQSQVVVPYNGALDLHEGMTLETWIKPSAEQEPEPAIISRAGNRYYVDLSSSAGSFHAATGGRFGQVPDYAILPERLAVDAWSHVAGTYDGQTLRLYVNAKLEGIHVHWSPHRAETTLNGATLLPGPAGDSGGLAAMLKHDVNLDAQVTCGDAAGWEAPIFVIASPQDTQAFAMDVHRAQLLLRPWTWARALHLASPATQIPDAFVGCNRGQTMTLSVQGRLQNPTVIRNGSPVGTMAASLGSAWGFLFHGDLLPMWLQHTATSLWLCCLLLPLGFWARVRPSTLVAFVIVAVTTFAAPLLFHVRPLNGLEMLAGAGGILVGATLQWLGVQRFTLAGSVRNAREFP